MARFTIRPAASALGVKTVSVDSFFEARRIARRRAKAGESTEIVQEAHYGRKRAIWRFESDGTERRLP